MDVSTTWLRIKDDGSGCDHDYSHKVEIERSELPPFVKGPQYDTYCAKCGTKQSLRERLAASLTEAR